MRVLAPLLVAALWAAGDPFLDGVHAYEEGRFREALERLAEAERRAGDGASAELLFDRALAALAAGDLRGAEAAAEKAAARGGPPFHPLRDFLLGNAALARSAWASAEADATDADPTALVRALAHAEDARDHWIRAATSRDDWPAARRNVERALRAVDELRRRIEEEDRRRRSQQQPPAPRPEDVPSPEDTEAGEASEEPPAPQPDAPQWTADELDRLLGVLAAKEVEKRALREARRAARGARVERDW